MLSVSVSVYASTYIWFKKFVNFIRDSKMIAHKTINSYNEILNAFASRKYFGKIDCIAHNCTWCPSEQILGVRAGSSWYKRLSSSNCTWELVPNDKSCGCEDFAVNWRPFHIYRKVFLAWFLFHKQINIFHYIIEFKSHREHSQRDLSIEGCCWSLFHNAGIYTFALHYEHYLRNKQTHSINTPARFNKNLRMWLFNVSRSA